MFGRYSILVAFVSVVAIKDFLAQELDHSLSDVSVVFDVNRPGIVVLNCI